MPPVSSPVPPLPPPPVPSRQPPGLTPQAGGEKKEPEIVVMPEKFYGMALNMKVPPVAEGVKPPVVAPTPAPKPMPPPVVAPHKTTYWPIVVALVVIVLLVAGTFVYLNRGLLFKAPAPVVPVVPVVVAPMAPTNLTVATTSVNGVALNWADVATNETGYRLERKEDLGTYLPLTNLPANSTAFLDFSVEPGKTYSYQVVAVNQGGESAPSNEQTVALPAAAPVAPVMTLPPAGLDSDSDGLTDTEEALYGTNAQNPDTDGDGFLDGNEVFNLYNPDGQAPIKLQDSGLVTALVSPAGWSMWIPAKWQATLDAPDGSRATISTGNGETFVISLEDNTQQQSVMDWYLAQKPGTLSTDVRSITTRGGLQGIVGADHLDAYFPWDNKIFAIRYNIDGQPFIYYRTMFEMMLNSLKLVGAPIITSATETLGSPGALLGTTSTATETLPLITSTSTQP